MTQKNYLIIIAIIATIGWSSWVLVINKLSPFSTPGISLSLFYSSLLIALIGSISLMMYYLKISLDKAKGRAETLNISLRQGTLLSIMIIVGILFQRLKVLTWWDGLLLLAIILMIEFYFTSRE